MPAHASWQELPRGHLPLEGAGQHGCLPLQVCSGGVRPSPWQGQQGQAAGHPPLSLQEHSRRDHCERAKPEHVPAWKPCTWTHSKKQTTAPLSKAKPWLYFILLNQVCPDSYNHIIWFCLSAESWWMSWKMVNAGQIHTVFACISKIRTDLRVGPWWNPRMALFHQCRWLSAVSFLIKMSQCLPRQDHWNLGILICSSTRKFLKLMSHQFNIWKHDGHKGREEVPICLMS